MNLGPLSCKDVDLFVHGGKFKIAYVHLNSMN